MPNNNLYTGADASLVLAVDDKTVTDGKLADALIGEYNLSSLVGRLKEVRVSVATDLRPYHEIGRRYPATLRSGNINVSGSAQRAHLNGALIRLLLGGGADSPPPTGSFAQPAFNMVMNLQNPALPGSANKLILFGVRFDSWSFVTPEDDFVMESVTFQAERISTEEQTATA